MVTVTVLLSLAKIRRRVLARLCRSDRRAADSAECEFFDAMSKEQLSGATRADQAASRELTHPPQLPSGERKREDHPQIRTKHQPRTGETINLEYEKLKRSMVVGR
jgi:hypothetical protein